MVPHSDPLTQLPQARVVQPVTQFRLTHQHDLQKFPIVRFEIRKQPDLLQEFIGQILRFINDQNCVLSALNLLQKDRAWAKDADTDKALVAAVRPAAVAAFLPAS